MIAWYLFIICILQYKGVLLICPFSVGCIFTNCSILVFSPESVNETLAKTNFKTTAINTNSAKRYKPPELKKKGFKKRVEEESENKR